MRTWFVHKTGAEVFTITVKDVMVDLEGWLEDGVDVYIGLENIEEKFVGSLIGWSTKSRGLLKKIVEQWKLNEL